MVLTLRLCDVYGSQNKQLLFPCTTLTVWDCITKWGVFTARYALSPYIKQTSLFVSSLKG